MTNVPNIGTADTISLVFDGFTHPAVGADNMNVESSVEYYDNGGTHHYTGIDYDYTIVTDSSYDTLTNYEGPVFSIKPVGSLNAVFEIKFTSPKVLNMYQGATGTGWADYVIIEFPIGFKP